MDEFTGGFILGIVSVLVVRAMVLTSYFKSTPSAIDVYRGKTTLEIVYRDSIPIDSIVVFK